MTVDEVISAIRRAVGTSKTAGQPEMRASTQAALDRIVQLETCPKETSYFLLLDIHLQGAGTRCGGSTSSPTVID